MTTPTDSLQLFKFGRAVFMTSNLLQEEVEALRKAVSVEKAAPQGVEKELTEFRASVSPSDALRVTLAESDN